jgi:superfamily II DNA or RNA helicase
VIARVRATVGAEIVLEGLSARSIERLRFALSYPHPDRVRAARMRRDPAGLPIRYECLTERPDGSVAAPRGAVDLVRAALAADDMGVDFDDRRTMGEPIGPLADLPHPLYAYQATAIARLLSKTQGMVVLPPGAGKTFLGCGAIRAIGRTAIVLAHTGDLIDQWVTDVRSLDVEPGVVDDAHKQVDAPIVVASIFSLAPLLEANPTVGTRFGLVVADECFPAGTMVNGRPIELVGVGDYVTSFDPKDGSLSDQRVLRCFKKKPTSLVRLTIADRVLICTPDHEIWTQDGWVTAADCVGRIVMLLTSHDRQAVRHMRKNIPGLSEPQKTVLQPEVPPPGTRTEGGHSALHHLPQDGGVVRTREAAVGEEPTSLLLRTAQASMAQREQREEHGGDQQEIQARHRDLDEDAQPDVDRGSPPEGVGLTPLDGLEAVRTRWQRQGADSPASVAGERSRVAVRSGGDDGQRSPSASLQDRRRERGPQDRNRGGRPDAQQPEGSGGRREEGRVAAWARVDRVEVLEPGRDGTFGGVCPDGLVYDLEVENNHTYFANGVAVSNCHHIPATTFQRCLRHLPARYRLGLTATPDRQDGHGKLVDWSFGPRLLVQTVPELVRGGFLLLPKLRVVETAFEHALDPDDPRRLTKLHRALARDEARNRQIAELAMWEVQAGETVLLLCSRKDHCKRLGKLLAKLGVDARVVIGTTKKTDRKEDLQALRDGAAPLVVATSLADEGLNVQRLSRLILAFPETARGKTIQRVGRLTRLWAGKEPVVVDVVDARVETLARRAAERRRSYRSIGMDA